MLRRSVTRTERSASSSCAAPRACHSVSEDHLFSSLLSPSFGVSLPYCVVIFFKLPTLALPSDCNSISAPAQATQARLARVACEGAEVVLESLGCARTGRAC